MNVAPSQNARGIVLMIFAMACFALADTLVKVSTASLFPQQIMLFLMTGGLIAFAGIAVVRGENLFDKRALSPVFIIRYFSEIVGMVGMIVALSQVPLSTVGAISQATPLLVVLGGVFYLGEKVSWRRWTAILIGFLGVLLIIQPGSDDFDMAVLWALIAMIGLAIRDITTRMVPPDMGSASLAAYTMIASIPFAVGWVGVTGKTYFPVDANWWIIGLMSFLGSIGYLVLIASIRMADISVVSPFRYSRLLFLLLLGIIVFDESPNHLVLLGAILIIVSGIYMVWREKRLKALNPN